MKGGSRLLWFLFSLCCYCVIINNNGVEGSHKIHHEYQCVPDTKVRQVHRTGYHFQPPRNWINDPNGPMYYNGIYHLFYQYNPKGAVWGNIVWAHSVSRNLIDWEALEPAIYPSKPFDINGCWSGSATILPGNKPAILYTGIDTQQRQVQNIAFPANLSDPYLRKWVKPDSNPLVVPDVGMNASTFRDPTTAWRVNGHWRMLVGARKKHRGINTGMWECPDFFPVSLYSERGLDTSVTGKNVRHVLKVSLDRTRYEYYTIGRYYPEIDRYIPGNTSADGWSGLRILWGWANESDTADNDTAKGWAGIQTIPRTLWLDKGKKQLLQWPIEELNTLRGQKIQVRNQELKIGENVEITGITAAQADVEVTFSLPSLDKAEEFDPSWVNAQDLCGMKGSTVQGGVGPFGLLTLASEHLEEYTPVFFRIFKAKGKHVVLMCSDAKSSSLRTELYKPSFAGFVDVDLKDGMLSLRSLIDHSVVESFGAGGKTCITSRVYPTLAVSKKAHLYAFNNGTEAVTIKKLNAWTMHRPQMN
ncbi:unnamed protein product, partial [Vitis vinifera]